MEGQGFWTGVTTDCQNRNGAAILHLELLNRSRIIRRVVGGTNARGTMLWRSDQLLLTPENDHFEGSMHLKANEGTNARLGEVWGGGRWFFRWPPSAKSVRNAPEYIYKMSYYPDCLGK